MVSQRRARTASAASSSSSPSSRERILDAAAGEFAARGFDGAKVDRIAKKARLNKAMLYYHFRNKAALHRAIIEELFGSLAAKVVARPVAHERPDVQIRWLIRTIAEHTAERPHFPSIWLREMAEGGRHIDTDVAAHLGTIIGTVGAILTEGRALGMFRPAHPLIVQMSIVAPLLLFDASAPARQRFAGLVPSKVVGIDRAAMLEHVERATLAALMMPVPESVAAPSVPVRPRRSRS